MTDWSTIPQPVGVSRWSFPPPERWPANDLIAVGGDLEPATLVNAVAVSVTGRAHATISNLTPRSVNFTYADIQQQTKKTVDTTDYVASLLSSLVGSLVLDVSVVGLTLGLPSLLQQTVGGIIANTATPVDQLLSGALTTLGLSLGQADVWVTGIRCDGAVLVN